MELKTDTKPKTFRALFNATLDEILLLYKNNRSVGSKVIHFFALHCDEWGDEELAQLIKTSKYDDESDPYHFSPSQNPLWTTKLKDNEKPITDRHKKLQTMYDFILTIKHNPMMVDIFS
jgi:hypothetical protein